MAQNRPSDSWEFVRSSTSHPEATSINISHRDDRTVVINSRDKFRSLKGLNICLNGTRPVHIIIHRDTTGIVSPHSVRA